jgi:hypothetical protein
MFIPIWVIVIFVIIYFSREEKLNDIENDISDLRDELTGNDDDNYHDYP